MAATVTLTVDELEARARDLSPQAAAELLARFLTALLARVAGTPALPAQVPSDPAEDDLLTADEEKGGQVVGWLVPRAP